jgi:hypothetical protein
MLFSAWLSGTAGSRLAGDEVCVRVGRLRTVRALLSSAGPERSMKAPPARRMAEATRRGLNRAHRVVVKTSDLFDAMACTTDAHSDGHYTESTLITMKHNWHKRGADKTLMRVNSHEAPRQVRWVSMTDGCVIEEWIPQLCSSHPDQSGSLAALILDPGPAEVCTSHLVSSVCLWCGYRSVSAHSMW